MITLIAQTLKYNIDFIGAKEGLSQSSVYFMLKDSRGFMWFSSYDGLNRYDGKNIKRYQANPNEVNAIKGTVVYGITEDPNGNLWIGTEEGLNYFNRQTEIFSFISCNKSTQQVHTCYADTTKIWYVGSEEGLVCYNFRTQKKEVIEPKIKLSNNYFQIFTSQYVSNGDIWMPSSTNHFGITRYNIKNNTVSYYFSNDSKNMFGKPINIYCFYYDEVEELLWFATKEGISSFDPNTLALTNYKSGKINFTNSYIYSLQKDKYANIWLGTENDGLVIFSPLQKKFKRLKDIQDLTPLHLNQDLVAKIYIDKEKDIIWANYEPQGIIKITPSQDLFNNDNGDNDNSESISSSVRCFAAAPDDKIFVGTLGDGLGIFNPKNRHFKKITPRDNLLSENIFQLFKKDDDEIWLGTLKGLILFNYKTYHSKNYKNQISDNEQNANIIRDIIEISNNEFALATENGVFFFDRDAMKFKNKKLMEGKRISKIYYDKAKKNLYVAAFDGGYCSFVMSESGLFQEIRKDDLQGATISHFFQLRDTLWMASNKGFWKVTQNFHQKKCYTVVDGLPNNTIYNFLLDNYNNFWLSTNYGLSKFNIASQKFTNYSALHGLKSYEYNINGYLKAPNGQLLFGGVNGIDAFWSEKITEENHSFPIKIIDLKINNLTPELDTVISEKKNLFLTYSQNNLQIKFQALDLLGNGNNQYRYKLNPLQNDWTYTSNSTIDFVELPYGNYTFALQGATLHGAWSSEIVNLSIFIAPPFWHTWWFRLLGLILIIISIWLVFNIQLKRKLAIQQIKFDKQQSIEVERNRIARDIHDDLGSGLSAIHLLSSYLKKKSFDPKIQIQVEKIAQLSAILSQKLKEIIWAMNSESEHLQGLSEFTRKYILELEELYQISFYFESNIPTSNIYLNKEIQYNLLQCVKELLNNGLKYSNATNINTTIKLIENNLEIIVQDDGIGFDVEKSKQQGNGLNNIYNRMKHINGKLIITSNAKGTRVVLNCPIS